MMTAYEGKYLLATTHITTTTSAACPSEAVCIDRMYKKITMNWKKKKKKNSRRKRKLDK
jgi:hypothetical protein